VCTATTEVFGGGDDAERRKMLSKKEAGEERQLTGKGERGARMNEDIHS
jgi:hypothetical protein